MVREPKSEYGCRWWSSARDSHTNLARICISHTIFGGNSRSTSRRSGLFVGIDSNPIRIVEVSGAFFSDLMRQFCRAVSRLDTWYYFW